MYDIIIIGAGPAGLTAAIYARRASKSVLLLEAMTYGGQIINTPDIENYPGAEHISGFDFAETLYNQATHLGAEFKFEKATGIVDNGASKTVNTPKNSYEAKAVIVATGSENRKLGVNREDDLIGCGISYCATCDGAFFRGKDVAVVGGGNTAIEDAIYLSDIANKVYLVHRRDGFRADSASVDLLKGKGNVEFVLGYTVKSLIGENSLEAVELLHTSGSTKTLNISGLFVAVGRIPENQNFASVIDLDDAGYALSGEDCNTKTKGIYVAGDNRTKNVRQLVTATSDGAIAATEAIKYISTLKI